MEKLISLVTTLQSALRAEMSRAGVSYEDAAGPLNYANKSSIARLLVKNRMSFEDTVKLMVLCNMTQASQSTQKLSALQLELLKIYSFEPSEAELIELKNLLARFFAQRFTEKASEAAKARHISDSDLDKWLEDEIFEILGISCEKNCEPI